MIRIISALTGNLFLSLVPLITAHGQVITLTFTGQYQAAPVPLDSVLAMNLTQGGDTMLYYPDTVLVLGTTGVDPLDAFGVFALRPNHPNPFSSGTNVDVQVQEAGPVRMGVVDGLGREVAGYHGYLSPGTHRFHVQGGLAGVQVLWVEMNGERRSIRMVGTGNEMRGEVKLQRVGEVGPNAPLKSGRSLFTWVPGDELRYIGYATLDGGSPVSGWIDEQPTIPADHVFMLSNGFVCAETPSVTDIDGNTYPVVRIGSQCWMAANLKTTRDRDGSAIPHVTDNTAWTQLTSGAWSNYENNAGYDAIYGKLYNWYAAANPNICPQGWHVPTDAEWTILTDHLGGVGVAGGKMKDTILWVPPNIGATNESGFSGLPGGYRNYNTSDFYDLINIGYWWSASEGDAENAWFRSLLTGNVDIYRSSSSKRNGFCIRCLRD